MPPKVKLPEVVTVPDPVLPFTEPVPPTDVTVPVYASLDVIVKLGYVPVTVVVPAPVKLTTWSGAVLVTVIEPLEVIGPPENVSPVVPPETLTDVTVPGLAFAHVGTPPAKVKTCPLVPTDKNVVVFALV